MARFIDAELFADRLLNAWDTADKEKKSEIVAILSDIVTPILVGTPAADVAPRAEVEKIFKEIAFVMKEYADRDIDEPELYARIGTIHRRFTKGENAQKDYFTPEEVRKMSQTEVRKNYQAIMDSMKKW